MNVEIAKLLRQGELERYVKYAADDPGGDSVLLCLDCEDYDPIEIEEAFAKRVCSIQLQKPIEIILLKAEFETLFLYSIDAIMDRFPDYEWIVSEAKFTGNLENIRNAKGKISRAMRNRGYKPTRDQEKFVSALDFDALIHRCASFDRLLIRLDRLLRSK